MTGATILIAEIPLSVSHSFAVARCTESRGGRSKYRFVAACARPVGNVGSNSVRTDKNHPSSLFAESEFSVCTDQYSPRAWHRADCRACSAERQNLMAAWMSGYFNAARNMPTVDFGRYATNKRRVAKHCRAHRDENLMRAIETVAF